MSFFTKMKLKLKRKEVLRLMEEKKLQEQLNEQLAKEKELKAHIAATKEKQDEETSFIGKEYPNYAEK